jgi:hypothetical protein
MRMLGQYPLPDGNAMADAITGAEEGENCKVDEEASGRTLHNPSRI